MPYRAIKLVIAPESRALLHERINRRFDQMIMGGLVDEVERLVAGGDLDPEMPSMRSVGYRQVWAWLRGEYGRDEMIEKGKAATRQLAKRQYTWLRSEAGATWLDPRGKQLDQALQQVARGWAGDS